MNIEIKNYFSGSVFLIESKKFFDNRGFFSEIYNKKVLIENNINFEFVQDNFSYSKDKGTIRGLHFQNYPFAQSKLIWVTHGKIQDVIVDIRKKSPTYGKYIQIEISEENFKQLYIPEGFAHGFCTLEDKTEVMYKVSNYYSPEHEETINYADKNLAIPWKINNQNAIISKKDQQGISFDKLQSSF